MLLYVDSQFTSPYAMSAFVGLHEKKLAFDINTVDLGAGANNDPKYASTSLTRRVPTLVHDNFSLSESSAITEYLEDSFPGQALYPAAAREKARARQVQAWLRSDLMALRQERSTDVIFYRPVEQPLSETAQRAAAKLCDVAAGLLAHGGGNLFDNWCIADVDLALMLNRLVLNHDQVPPQLVEYAQRQWARPSIQLWVNQPRPPM